LVNHWVRYDTDEPFIPNLVKIGFVYVITNIKTKKAYVGCKQYYIGKAKKESRWQTYMGSSKYLKEDIKKIGKKHFRFEAIAEYKNKRSLRYYEAHYQMKWDVLTSVIEGTDEPAFYNSYVGGKFYRPVESYKPHTEETKKKMSESHKGFSHTEETKKKIGKAQVGEKHHMFGKKHTEETKKKIGEGQIGRKHTEETKRKMSEKQKGEKHPMFGKKHTEESKNKMSSSKIGEKHPMFGKKHTEESKKKMRKPKQLRRRKEENDVNQESNVRHSTS